MHQTTIRFSPKVWRQLESEAHTGGVSAAQYVREAVVERLTSAAIRREAAEQLPTAPPQPLADESGPGAVRAASVAVRSDTEAVWAQARLARTRAQEVRARAHLVQDAVRAQRRV